MTESVVALPHGSPVRGVDNPRASARARGKGSVTHRERVAGRKGARLGAAARRAGTRTVVWGRTTGRVMYLDAADSWIVRESAPSIRQVWATDYAALARVNYTPFRIWCRFWRYPAVLAAASLDSVKWALIHPVRGPLFLTATGAGIAVAVL